MQHDTREARVESIQVLMPWGLPLAEDRENVRASAAFWLTGGVSILVWTGLALLLTSA